MSRFVVVVNSADAVSDWASEHGADVLDEAVPTGNDVAAVVHFEDDVAGIEASHEVNGSCFGSEWAAREHARHRATSA